MQTCLAMLLDEPVEKVISVFGAAPLSHKQLIHALNTCGVMWNQFVQGTLVATGWYIAAVPSLNNRGGSHAILFHYNVDYGCSGFQILDPSTKDCYAADGSDLKAWSNLIYFQPGGRLPETTANGA